MTIQAFSGGAGCGKTYELVRALSAHLNASPLAKGQKILALTFMHGSRRRLEERLAKIPLLRKRANCTTLDSFAWSLVRRWRSLASRLGHAAIDPSEYDRVCHAAGDLAQIAEVRAWVAASYPILLVDEAQDLTTARLRVVQGLAMRLEVFVAADEFQCLNEQLRPNPACRWLREVCKTEELTQPRRTNAAELLDAAAAIRAGLPPRSGKIFKIQLTPRPPLAGAWLNGNLRYYGGGRSVAIITPSLGVFARNALAWSAANATSAGAGPYAVGWEESEANAATAFTASLALQELSDIPTVTALLTGAGDPRAAREVRDWMDMQRRARSKVTFSRDEIGKAVDQIFAQRRRSSTGDDSGWRAMTVHGAKNREFDNVILLWPAAVVGSADQRRRLLYNAITRAKLRCLVLVQTSAQLAQPPFA